MPVMTTMTTTMKRAVGREARGAGKKEERGMSTKSVAKAIGRRSSVG
jgi:hypothetical protein